MAVCSGHLGEEVVEMSPDRHLVVSWIRCRTDLENQMEKCWSTMDHVQGKILEVAVKSCGQKVTIWGVEAADRYRLAKWASVRAFMEAFKKVKKQKFLS